MSDKPDEKEVKKNPFEKKKAEPIRKAKAPCPKCGSWNTTVENGIFYCADCDFEG